MHVLEVEPQWNGKWLPPKAKSQGFE